MSGDYFSHTDRKYDEIIERLEALEKKVASSKLLMKRTDDGHYEKLVDRIICADLIKVVVKKSVTHKRKGLCSIYCIRVS